MFNSTIMFNSDQKLPDSVLSSESHTVDDDINETSSDDAVIQTSETKDGQTNDLVVEEASDGSQTVISLSDEIKNLLEQEIIHELNAPMPPPVFNELEESTSVLVGSEPSTGFFDLNHRAPQTEWFTGTPPKVDIGLTSEEDEAGLKNPE